MIQKIRIQPVLDFQRNRTDVICLTKKSQEKIEKEGHRWKCKTASSGIKRCTMSNGHEKNLSTGREEIVGSRKKKMEDK